MITCFYSTTMSAWETCFLLTCLSKRADTDERGDAVNACRTMAAGSRGTVINVIWAVYSTPSIDTNTDEATLHIVACATILASVRLKATLIHILHAVLACTCQASCGEGQRGEKSQFSLMVNPFGLCFRLTSTCRKKHTPNKTYKNFFLK